MSQSRWKQVSRWSLKRPSDMFFLSIAAALGLSGVWFLPLTSLFKGSAYFVLFQFTAFLLVGLPLVLAEFVLGRWLLRPFYSGYEALGQVLGFFSKLSFVAVLALIPLYLNEGVVLLRHAFLVLSRGALVEPASYDFLRHDRLGNYLGALILYGVGAFCLLLKTRHLASFVKVFLFFVFGALGFTIYGITSNWSSFGWVHLLFVENHENLATEFLKVLQHFPVYSLAAGFGLFYTFAYQASLAATRGVQENEKFWSTRGVLQRGSLRILSAAGLLSFFCFLLISPFSWSPGFVPSTSLVLYEWVPQILVGLKYGPWFVGLYFLGVLMLGFLGLLILLEFFCSNMEHAMQWSRRRVLLHGFFMMLLLSLVPVFELLRDGAWYIVAYVLAPFLALILSVIVGWRMPLASQRQIWSRGLAADRVFLIWRFLLRYFLPPLLAALVLSGLRTLMGWR